MLHQRGGSRTGAGRPSTGRSASLTVQVTPALKATLETNAKLHRISVSEYLERILLAYLSEDPDVAPSHGKKES